jgi:hypothetical protein
MWHLVCAREFKDGSLKELCKAEKNSKTGFKKQTNKNLNIYKQQNQKKSVTVGREVQSPSQLTIPCRHMANHILF